MPIRSLLHQQYNPIILSSTPQTVSSYVYYLTSTSAKYPDYSHMESATYLTICHYISITLAILSDYSLMDSAICLITYLLYLQYISNLTRLLSQGICNLSHHMSLYLYYISYIVRLLSRELSNLLIVCRLYLYHISQLDRLLSH